MLYIKVPASTSNLGPGFDSIGMAVNLYLELEVSESDEWHFHHIGEELNQLPEDESHYIVKMCNYFIDQFHLSSKKFNITMTTEIPLARGLGSSASALIASLEIVNHYYQLNLSVEEKINILTEVEGHPDNAAPSVIGGLVVGYYDSEANRTYTCKLNPIKWPLAVIIPDYELKTSDARDALPETINYKDAVEQNALTNMLITALNNEDYDTAGKMMMKDKLHEPFRKNLVPHYMKVKEILKDDVYMFLSGAGPSIFLMMHPNKAQHMMRELKKLDNCVSIALTIDDTGVITQVNDNSMIK